LIILVIFGEDCRLWNFSFCSFLEVKSYPILSKFLTS
jgi:hypothetical protein